MAVAKTKTFTQHAQTDSKLLWTVIFAIGIATGNVDRVLEVFIPSLDKIYVTKVEFQEFKDSLQPNPNLSVE